MKKNNTSVALLSGARRDSGSALITAVIFAFVIGALSVSYLKMAGNEHRAAVRSSLYASCLNLAESGVEMAIADLSAGSGSGSQRTGASANFLADAGVTGDVQYVIFNANSSNPTVYSEGSIYSDVMPVVTKQVKVDLTTGFQPFEKGFASRNGISFSGSNVTLDSFNSNYGPYDVEVNSDGAAVGYGTLESGVYKNRNDDIYVASAFLDDSGGVLKVGNGTVYGYVQTDANSSAEVKNNGAVTTYDGENAGENQPDRITSDFYADYPVADQPSGFYPTVNINGTMPIVGSNDADNPLYYDVSGISLSGKAALTIVGHVVFVMSGDVSVSGKASVVLDDTANSTEFDDKDKGSSLTIYTANNLDIGGNGVTNDGGVASDFSVIGTAEMDGSSAGQTIKVAGNGVLAASVYAPNGDVTINGGGSSGNVYGGVVALNATIVGGGVFHFDEALRDNIEGAGKFAVTSWLEMTNETSGSSPIDIASYFDVVE
ncbi:MULTISPECIES: hypothetical protein [unclassified Lentimonas]|uniref:DUF7305 domain-containing protein n=1 Tax=unclassified Lentimonas TaxID=2630993 RepID=UPI00132C6CB9|nr:MULTISPECIES: hypothetical protein [unclassified Lentimonas]CAA6678303.1 Unannotated [Lentimonas sp. CC4]CAA6684802.1 Unannotated [Lentimonas sp. CC6]CAA7076844.1 Unannotated [Lentimonas sp. CC4]CAA7170758.1 Unannotated [Lentimonas sp. CC21]CAA7179680.1 Unannotated [Lentimonas sp. CC8]